MQNEIAPYVVPPTPIELGGKTRYMRLDFAALGMIERKIHRSLMDKDSWVGMKTTDIVTLLLAVLLHEDPSLTETIVKRWIHRGNLLYVVQQIGTAWSDGVNGDQGKNFPLELREAA